MHRVTGRKTKARDRRAVQAKVLGRQSNRDVVSSVGKGVQAWTGGQTWSRVLPLFVVIIDGCLLITPGCTKPGLPLLNVTVSLASSCLCKLCGMAPIPLTRWTWLALLAAKAYADCSCAGLDYTNGGSYLIDGSVDADFSFNSVFDGM